MSKNTGSQESFRTFLAVLGLLATFATAGQSTAAPAAPISRSSKAALTSNANLRPCVTLRSGRCAPVGTTAGTHIAAVFCHRTGSWATGEFRSNVWLLVLLDDGREGYVHASFVIHAEPTPTCTSVQTATR
jgi:hypothetical protein